MLFLAEKFGNVCFFFSLFQRHPHQRAPRDLPLPPPPLHPTVPSNEGEEELRLKEGQPMPFSFPFLNRKEEYGGKGDLPLPFRQQSEREKR